MTVVFVSVALLAQSAYRATATTITTNNPQVQADIRSHSSNHQTEPVTKARTSKAKLYVTTLAMY